MDHHQHLEKFSLQLVGNHWFSEGGSNILEENLIAFSVSSTWVMSLTAVDRLSQNIQSLLRKMSLHCLRCISRPTWSTPSINVDKYTKCSLCKIDPSKVCGSNEIQLLREGAPWHAEPIIKQFSMPLEAGFLHIGEERILFQCFKTVTNTLLSTAFFCSLIFPVPVWDNHSRSIHQTLYLSCKN